MSLENLVQFASDYTEAMIALPLVGVAVGAWLSNFYFPLKFKRREWHWEKEIWAREILFETISRVSFVASHYIKGEKDDHFSMSGTSLTDANDEITRLIRDLHSSGHKIKLYLNKHNSKVFEEYLRDSQLEFDSAKESWSQWYPDDTESPIIHTENVIANQGKVADKALGKFKLSS